MSDHVYNVLFLYTGNTARSILAERPHSQFNMTLPEFPCTIAWNPRSNS